MTVNSIDTLCLATAVAIMSMVAVSIVLLLQKQHAQQQEYFYATNPTNPTNPVPYPANAPPPALTEGQNVQLEKQKLMDKTHTDKYVTDYTHISNALSKNNKDISSSNVNEKSEKNEKSETNTLYKDPKDMTPKEQALFKKLLNHDNFTVQDYKNWLRLYQNEYFLLSEAHLLNLRNMLRGERLQLSDIPGGIPVISSQQQYYARMYDKLGAERHIHTPATSFTAGPQVGYNYNDFGQFSPPLAMPQLNVVNGEIERTFRPLKNNHNGNNNHNNHNNGNNNNNNKKSNAKKSKMQHRIISIPLEDVQPPFPVSPSM